MRLKGVTAVTYRILLAAAAVSGTVFGLLFVFVPETAFALFGARLDPLGSLLVRQLGGVILGLAWMDWLIRNVTDRPVQTAVVVGNVTAFVVIAVVAMIAAATGLINFLGWGVAAFHIGVAIGLVASQRSWSR